jgi:pantoate kinase
LLKASSFVPGHITGFFEIHDSAEDIKQRGSRGAGICLSLGIRASVAVSESKVQSIEVLIDDKIEKESVTEVAIKNIIGETPYEINVESKSELPQGQGFGMSGAGALGASLALDSVLGLNLPMENIICAAHSAEVACGTGLGDVMPQSVGGIVIRKKEGCPPYGILEKIDSEDIDIVLCIIGEELSTKSIITDTEHRKKINENGHECISQLIKDPKLWELMWLSLAFSKSTELMVKEVEEAVMAARKHGLASMSMLGNSIFAMGDTRGLISELQSFGKVYTCKVDKEGARIVDGGK